jgi:hypothetical protein
VLKRLIVWIPSPPENAGGSSHPITETFIVNHFKSS